MEYLDENNVAFEVIDFIDDPLSEMEIKTVLRKLGINAEDLIRKTDALFLENFADKTFSEEEWIDVLVKNPSLIQRPILIKNSVAMVGRPLENVKFFIEK